VLKEPSTLRSYWSISAHRDSRYGGGDVKTRLVIICPYVSAEPLESMVICCRTERFTKHYSYNSQRPLTTSFGIGFSNFRDSRSGNGMIALD
jgi:hypothetical protein